MRIGFFKMFAVVGAVGAWFTKATEDGKIDPSEAVQLVEEICRVLGIKAEIEIPTE